MSNDRLLKRDKDGDLVFVDDEPRPLGFSEQSPVDIFMGKGDEPSRHGLIGNVVQGGGNVLQAGGEALAEAFDLSPAGRALRALQDDPEARLVMDLTTRALRDAQFGTNNPVTRFVAGDLVGDAPSEEPGSYGAGQRPPSSAYAPREPQAEPRPTVDPAVHQQAIDDSVERLNARLRSGRAGYQDEDLTEEELRENPRYLELARQLADIEDQLATLESGVEGVNQSAADSAARTAGVAPQARAEIGEATAGAQEAIGASTAEAEAGIRDAYDVANANLDRVLEVQGSDAYTEAALSSEVNQLADEFLEEAQQQGASAEEMAAATGEVSEAVADQMAAESDLDREEARSLTVLGLEENIRVAARQRERAAQDQELLEQALQDDADRKRMESLALNVPLTKEGFGREVILGDWMDSVAGELGMELSEEEQQGLYQVFSEELSGVADDPEQFAEASTSVIKRLLEGELGRKLGADKLSDTAFQYALAAAKFDPETGFSIDSDAIRQSVASEVDVSLDNVEVAEAVAEKLGITTTEVHARRQEPEVQNALKEAQDEQIDALLGELDVANLDELITEDLQTEAKNTYQMLQSIREQKQTSDAALEKWLENQNTFQAGTQPLAVVTAAGFENAGYPNAAEIAQSHAWHQLVGTLNPEGTPDGDIGSGILNLPSTVFSQYGRHLGEPDELKPVEQMEAVALWLNDKYQGSPWLALQHLIDNGRV